MINQNPNHYHHQQQHQHHPDHHQVESIATEGDDLGSIEEDLPSPAPVEEEEGVSGELPEVILRGMLVRMKMMMGRMMMRRRSMSATSYIVFNDHIFKISMAIMS